MGPFYGSLGFMGRSQGRKKQDQQGKSGERHEGNGDVAEFQNESTGAGFSQTCSITREKRISCVVNVVVVGRDNETQNRHSQSIVRKFFIFFPKRHANQKHLGIHENSFVPTEFARSVMGNF